MPMPVPGSAALAVCIAVLVPAPAFARTWTVLADGSGDAPTIQAAADSAAAGDSILVHPGTYAETVHLPGGITLVGVGGAAATEIAPDAVGYAVAAADAVIEGLTLAAARSTSYPMPWSGGFGLEATGTTVVRDCEFRDSDEGGIRATGDLEVRGSIFRGDRLLFGDATGGPSDRLLVEDCILEDVSDWEAAALHVSGWTFAGTAIDVTIRDSVFRRCRSPVGWEVIGLAGIERLALLVEGSTFVENDGACLGDMELGIPGSVRAWGDYVADVVVRNCTFARSEDAIVVEQEATGSSFAIEACLFTRNRRAARLVDPGFAYAVTCSDVWENGLPWEGTADPVGTDGNFAAAPLYCAPGSEDFSLAGNSPCLPSGNDCGVRVGAFGEGCGPMRVDETSWGRLRSAYRDR